MLFGGNSSTASPALRGSPPKSSTKSSTSDKDNKKAWCVFAVPWREHGNLPAKVAFFLDLPVPSLLRASATQQQLKGFIYFRVVSVLKTFQFRFCAKRLMHFFTMILVASMIKYAVNRVTLL